MGLFDSFGGIGGGILGGLAGNVAGLPGMIGGGLLGARVGNMLLPGQGGSGDYGGMPGGYPTYVGMEPNSTQIASQFSGPNPAMNKFVGDSMRTGPSAATQWGLQQNTADANAGREMARKSADGLAANAESNLSMKGGLGAGAAERIQKNANNAALDFSNQSDNAAAGRRTNLLQGDEAARTGNLGMASNMIQGANEQGYNMKAGDVGRMQGELARRNAYNLGLYNTNMSTWASGKQADATANSGKK